MSSESIEKRQSMVTETSFDLIAQAKSHRKRQADKSDAAKKNELSNEPYGCVNVCQWRYKSHIV